MAEESKVVAKNIGANPNPNQMMTYIVLGLIALLIIILLAAMYIIFKFKFPKVIYQPVQNQQQQQNITANNTSSDKFGELVPLNQLDISLAISSSGIDYLRVNVTLEVAEDEKVKAEMEKRVPQFQDLIITIGKSMTAEQLNKNEGKDAFRSEILQKINNIVGTGKVKNVFFTEYILFVQ